MGQRVVDLPVGDHQMPRRAPHGPEVPSVHCAQGRGASPARLAIHIRRPKAQGRMDCHGVHGNPDGPRSFITLPLPEWSKFDASDQYHLMDLVA